MGRWGRARCRSEAGRDGSAPPASYASCSCCAGDEVVEPGTAVLGPGQIRDANRSMLLAAATKAGAKVWGKGGGVFMAREAQMVGKVPRRNRLAGAIC